MSEDDRRRFEERVHPSVVRFRHCVQDLLGADREHLRGRSVCAEILSFRAINGPIGVAHHDGMRVRDAPELRVYRGGDLAEEEVGEGDHAGSGGSDRGAIQARQELRRDPSSGRPHRVHPRNGFADRRTQRGDRCRTFFARRHRGASAARVARAVRLSPAVAARSAHAGPRFARQREGLADRDREVHRVLRAERAGRAQSAGTLQRVVQRAVPLLRVRRALRTAVLLRHQLLLRAGVQRRRADPRRTQRHDVHDQQPGRAGGGLDGGRRAGDDDDEHRATQREGRAGHSEGSRRARRTALSEIRRAGEEVEARRLL